jgi:hypothetical protein
VSRESLTGTKIMLTIRSMGLKRIFEKSIARRRVIHNQLEEEDRLIDHPSAAQHV